MDQLVLDAESARQLRALADSLASGCARCVAAAAALRALIGADAAAPSALAGASASTAAQTEASTTDEDLKARIQEMQQKHPAEKKNSVANNVPVIIVTQPDSTILDSSKASQRHRARMSKSQSKTSADPSRLAVPPRHSRNRRTRSTATPALSEVSGRLPTVVEKDAFVLSSTKRSEIEAPRPGASGCKRLQGSSRDVFERETAKYESEVEKNKQNPPVAQIVVTKPTSDSSTVVDSEVQHKTGCRKSSDRTNIEDQGSIKDYLRPHFNKGLRNKPVFPAALINPTNKSEPAQWARRKLFGRGSAVRKNMFADFKLLQSDSEEDSEDQYEIFDYKKNNNQTSSLGTRNRRTPSLTPSMTTETDIGDWHLLPSSTRLGDQEVSKISADHVTQEQEENQDDTLTEANKSLNCEAKNLSTHNNCIIQHDENDKTLTNENREDTGKNQVIKYTVLPLKTNKKHERNKTVENDRTTEHKKSRNLTKKSQKIVESSVVNDQIDYIIIDETIVKSPEAVLQNMTNDDESFRPIGHSTTRRNSEVLHETMNILSLEPVHETTLGSEVSRNLSPEGSMWDSHLVTRKAIQQTLGREYITSKSLRALVMEQSAKRQTELYSKNISNINKKSSQQVKKSLIPRSPVEESRASDIEMKEKSFLKGMEDKETPRRNASVRTKSIYGSDEEVLDYEPFELEESEQDISDSEVDQKNVEQDDSVQDEEKENSEPERDNSQPESDQREELSREPEKDSDSQMTSDEQTFEGVSRQTENDISEESEKELSRIKRPRVLLPCINAHDISLAMKRDMLMLMEQITQKNMERAQKKIREQLKKRPIRPKPKEPKPKPKPEEKAKAPLEVLPKALLKDWKYKQEVDWKRALAKAV